MRSSKNMFSTVTTTNPFNGERRDTKVILIDIALIRSWPGTVRNEVVGRRERAREGGREGRGGEGCAAIG